MDMQTQAQAQIQQTPQQRQISFFERYLNGEFDNHPMVKRLNNMLFGKSPQEQFEITLNFLESNGYDIHQKNIPEEVVKRFLDRLYA